MVDLLGNGTACLVWSSPLAGDSRRPMRYIDLMGGQKPHLLVAARNNLGAETRVHYAPSTRFYVQDRDAGTPWITRLPFPVHVVERVETLDRISRNRFVTRYSYHHGYFDGVEREFRGFGRVDQWDTEEIGALRPDDTEATNIDAASYVPPVHTRTWFHTGVYLGRAHVSDFLPGCSTADRGSTTASRASTDRTSKRNCSSTTPSLPEGLTVEEEREACRALKGSMLRQEIYALDGTGTADQRRAIPTPSPNRTSASAVCSHRPETATRCSSPMPASRSAYHYERNPADPRIAHQLTLAVDAFGNVLRSATIGYGRRQADGSLLLEDQTRQMQLLATYSENEFTPAIDLPDAYRVPGPSEIAEL